MTNARAADGPDISVFDQYGFELSNGGTMRFPSNKSGDFAFPQGFTVTNRGNQTLTGLALTRVNSATAFNFAITTNLTATSLAPGSSATFAIKFSASGSPGDRTATFLLASNDPDTNPFTLNAYGLANAVSAPEIQLHIAPYPNYVGSAPQYLPHGAGAYQFSPIGAGSLAGEIKTLAIANVAGSGNLNLSFIWDTAGNPGDFILSPSANTSINQPISYIYPTIEFRPTAPGLRTATLRIWNNDPDENPYVLTFSGEGLYLPPPGSPPELIVTELNYNPPGEDSLQGNQHEFIEIKNIGSHPINLVATDFRILGGNDQILYSAKEDGMEAPVINPGEFRVFCQNTTAFRARYSGAPFHGHLVNGLSNTTERIHLTFGGRSHSKFIYGSSNPWTSLPDGTGFTLVARDTARYQDPKDPLNWRASTNLYGSPGSEDPAPPLSPVVISELKTRDDSAANSDVFELANLSYAPEDIGGWFLSDSSDNLRRFRIPPGTVIAPRGYITFTQAQVGFGISGAGDDELMLFAADSSGAFTGYKHSALPGPSHNARSFNRVVTTDGREFFAPSESNTLGAANSAVRPGAVVFSEISFQPSLDPSVQVRSEYIEIVNRSSATVPLYTAAGPWRIRGIAAYLQADFIFPAGLSLAPGEIVLLIPHYSPIPDDTLVSQFRSAYRVPSGVTKIYPFRKSDPDNPTFGIIPNDGELLSNNSQNLELLRPSTYPVSGGGTKTIYVTEDRAHYRDDNGWPNRASGDGPGYLARSLVRANPDLFGSEPDAWDSSPAHGGTPGYAVSFTPPSVVISEVLAHSDLTNPAHPALTDFIELQNTSSLPVDISGWWLSNSSNNVARAYDKRLANPAYVLTEADSIYQIPAGTVIPPGGYWTVNSDDDDNVLTAPPVGFFGRFFTLSSRGDSLRLVAMDAAKFMTGPIHKTDFDASENAVSFVRHVNSEGRETFLPSTAVTAEFSVSTAFPAGAPNASPAVSPVVISEVMYAAPSGGYQFIELFNRSASSIALYDNFNEIPGNTSDPRHNPGNGWRIPSLDYTLPSPAGNRPNLEPGEFLLLTNAPSEAAFRAFYSSTPPGVRILSWGTASLAPFGERLKLQKPDAEDTVLGSVVVPYVSADELRYRNTSPWPAPGFPGGFPLERRDPSRIADDAGNWGRSSRLLGTPGSASAILANSPPLPMPDLGRIQTGFVLSLAAPGVLSNDFDLDPGTVLTAELVTPPPPSEGLVVFQADGSFAFTPAAGFLGLTSFTYRVTDAATPGLSPADAFYSLPVTVSITVLTPPLAEADSYTTNEDTPLSITAPGLLGNDVKTNAGTVLAAQLVSAPPAAQGRVTLKPDGSFVFTPAFNFHGTTSFTYRTADDFLQSEAVAVTLTVSPVNDAPVTGADGYATDEDTELTVAAPGVLVNDTDPEGDPNLTASLVSGPFFDQGFVTLKPDGSFSFKPYPNFTGTASFSYRVSDGQDFSPSRSVVITVRPVNDLPQAQANFYTTPENTLLSRISSPRVPFNATITVSSSIVTVTTVSGNLPTWVTNSSSVTVSGGLPSAYNGAKSVSSVTASNSFTFFTTSTAITDNTVSISPPTLTTPGDPLGVLVDDTDNDSTAASLTAQLVSPPPADAGSLVFNANGSFTFAPASGFSGLTTFTYRTFDGLAYSLPATVTLLVGKPLSGVADTYSVKEDETLSVPAPGLLANDVKPYEGSTLTALVTSFPSASQGVLTWNPDGSFVFVPASNFRGSVSFYYAVKDGFQTAGSIQVTINVLAVNDPPSAVADTYTIAEDTPLSQVSPPRVAFDATMAISGTTVTVTALSGSLPSWLAVGSPVTIAGGLPTSYNGFKTVSALNGTNRFTFMGTGTSIIKNTITVTPLPLTTPGDPLGVLFNDTDIDSNAISLSASLASPPPTSAGSLVFNSNGSFVFTPALNFSGATSFTYRTFDGSLYSEPATVTLNVTPTNDPPLAQADSFMVKKGTTLTVPAAQGLLLNDTDPDGGDRLSVQLMAVLTPPQGTLSLAADGSFVFTPFATFAGTVTFGYRASDGMMNSNTATVTIVVSEDSDLDGLDDAWERVNFGTLSVQGSDDPDGDGMGNLEEFAFGTNPVVPSSGDLRLVNGALQNRGRPVPVLIGSTGADYRAVFCRLRDHSAHGLIYRVQFSADLAVWETSLVSPTVLADDGDVQAVSVPYPFFLSNGRKARFFRVAVSANP